MRWTGAFLALGLAGAAQALPPPREIAFVGNAEGGTVSLIDVAARKVVGEIDINPERAPQNRPGTKNYAQDTDVSPDGRTLYVSRGYSGDVAAFDIMSGRQLWKRQIDPTRADHMALTPDGRFLFASAYTRNRAVKIDTKTGMVVGEIVTGVAPHDNQISADGRLTYNTSIGDMAVPEAQRDNVSAPGETSGWAYQLTITDVATLKNVSRVRFAKGIRPWRFAPGGKVMYAQTSNDHAVTAFDPATGKALKRLDLPKKPGIGPADWVFDAPHHGLSLTPDGKTICIAGRGSDYAALLKAPELTLIATIPVGDAPGWSEVAENGKTCLIANTGADDVSILSIPERKEIVRLKVGDGPKHISVHLVPAGVLRQMSGKRQPS
jgi:DNA-binding beta-propeller fold protein YncE